MPEPISEIVGVLLAAIRCNFQSMASKPFGERSNVNPLSLFELSCPAQVDLRGRGWNGIQVGVGLSGGTSSVVALAMLENSEEPFRL